MDSQTERTCGCVRREAYSRFAETSDTESSETAPRQLGQPPFFAEYLRATGLFEDWVGGCSLSYVSPNAPKLTDVLGTWMLSILDGHNRYAHVVGAGLNLSSFSRSERACSS